MKQVFALFLTIIILFSFTCPAFAVENENPGSLEPFFSESEAADIALLFVYKNIEKSDDCWSLSTYIDSVFTLYNFNDTIVGYTFCLNTNNKSSGYITVSASQDYMPIQEYSFIDQPIFVEKLPTEQLLAAYGSNRYGEANKSASTQIIFNGPLEYYTKTGGDSFSLDGVIIDPALAKKSAVISDSEARSLNIKLKEIIAESHTKSGNYNGQLSGYVISDRFAYMNDRYGSYTYENSGSLSGFVGLNMANFGGSNDNDCSLVSITAVANWYRSQYPNIPGTAALIYDDVLDVGTSHGYTASGGTNPTVIDDIFEDVFSEWGYSISSSNTYVWSFTTFKNQINSPNSNPLLFNIATGYYSNHTITVIGFAEYDVADFLMVKDNWSTSTRYIHWQQMWNEIGSVTTINA